MWAAEDHHIQLSAIRRRQLAARGAQIDGDDLDGLLGLATSPGGSIVATNHAASVDREEWVAILRRCAEKAGRPLAAVESIVPEADFPSRDGHPPLKIAVCSTAP